MSGSKSSSKNVTETDIVYDTTTTTTTNVGDIGLTGEQIVTAIDKIGNLGVMITDTLSSRLLSVQQEQSAQISDIVESSQSVSQAATRAGIEAQSAGFQSQAIGAQLQAYAANAASSVSNVSATTWVIAGASVIGLFIVMRFLRR